MKLTQSTTAQEVSIIINPNCSDDFIQAQLLKCIFILRHRQKASKRNYLDPVANEAKWTVFWETLSQYSLSMVHNQDDKSNEILINALLFNHEYLDNWNDDKSCSQTEEKVNISTSEWLPLHSCLLNSTKLMKVLSLAYIKSDGNQESTSEVSKTEVTALHLTAASNYFNLKSINNILEHIPCMASIETADGILPLHLAAKHSNNIEIIESLIKAYPQGLEKKCALGEIPLFNACLNRHDSSLQIVQKMIQTTPHIVKFINSNGETALHLAIQRLKTSSVTNIEYETSVNIIKTLLIAYPEGVAIQDIYGDTPLHTLCRTEYFPGIDSVFEFMLKFCPTNASVLNEGQQTPLHKLLRDGNGHRKDVNILIPMFLDVYPEAVSLADKDGCYPIHYAVMYDLDLTHIERIINGNPAALLARGSPKYHDGNAMTPMQLSLRRYSDTPDPVYCDKLTLVKYLYSRCPESIHIRSEWNDTLLYNAVKYCEYSNKDMIVKAVYDMDPSAAMSVNQNEETPLFSAFDTAVNDFNYPFPCLEQVRFLLRMCPAAITVKNKYGISPLKEATRPSYGSSIDDYVLHRMLLQAMPRGNKVLKVLSRLNYKVRRMAMFLFFTAIFGDKVVNNDNIVEFDHRVGGDSDKNEEVEYKNGAAELITKLRKFDPLIVRRIILLL